FAVWSYWQLACRWMPQRPLWAAAPAYALIAILASPGVGLVARIAATHGSLATLGLDRAPVVIEPGRAQRFADVRSTIEYIRRNSEPDATLLGFPGLQFLNYL